MLTEEDLQKLPATAALNNKGVEFEKAQQFIEAIEVYEANVAIGYPATHSFTRLLVIYRRLKRYEDELRIVNAAIRIFANRRYIKDVQKWESRRVKILKLLTDKV